MCCSYIQLKLKPFCLRSQLCSQWQIRGKTCQRHRSANFAQLANQRQNLNQRHRSDSEPRCMHMMHITNNSKRAVMRELKLYTESGSGRGTSNGIWDGQLAVQKSKIISEQAFFVGKPRSLVAGIFVVSKPNFITGFDGVFCCVCASGFHVTDASICVMLLSTSACGILPFDACSQM